MSGFSIDTIAPDMSLKLSFGSSARKAPHVRVLSTDKTDVYVLDKDGKDAYDRGEEFESLISSEDRTVHVFKSGATGKWWLVIANCGDKEVSCSYEVLW